MHLPRVPADQPGSPVRFYFQICAVSLLAIAASADKKIELTDIEEDNLKSEQEKEQDKIEAAPQTATGDNISALDFFKSGLLRYFENPQPQQPRYVQQYAVTEPPEKPPTKPPHQTSPGPNQAMVGYLSNVPMQIYLVPQYYNDQTEQGHANSGMQYASNALSRVSAYTAPEATQPQANYIEVPAYVTPTGKAYMPHYQQPQYQQQVSYVTYTPQPAVTATNPHMTVVTAPASVHGSTQPILYQMPVSYQYPTAIMAPPVYPKSYYAPSQITENTIEETQESGIESPKQYEAQTESPYTKSPEYPRYYTSRAPLREEQRPNSIQELPPPNPLLLRHPPPHLSHLPKALPYYRPVNKPVYATGGGIISNAIQRPGEAYGLPFRRRPSSLLDSYIPSSVQVEYLKRGYGKDPLQVYDALSGNRNFSPRHFERGFLPNQMYHTAAGGVTFGHYKRTPKPEKLSQA